MGVTIHFKLHLPLSPALTVVEVLDQLRRRALRYRTGGRVDAVLPVRTDDQALRHGRTLRFYPSPGEFRLSGEVELVPRMGFVLPVIIGKDCEPLWLGLARYPDGVERDGQCHLTRLTGLRWEGSCKTQFASLHGWEHFRRCHLAVLGLLEAVRRLGCRVTVSDEGEYWHGRNEAALRQNVEQMNGAIAAAAGAMKDFDRAKGAAGVQSPIFAHPQFEHLEAEGAARGHAAALRKVLSKSGSMASPEG
jgi:hypothetical protein